VLNWTLAADRSKLPALLSVVVDATFSKLDSYVDKSSDVLKLFSRGVRAGAVGPKSVLAAPVGPECDLIPFELALTRSVHANLQLRNSLLDSSLALQIDKAVAALPVPSISTFNVKQILSSFADRVVEQPLGDIPDTVSSQGCQQYGNEWYSTLPFDDFCTPPTTHWLPLLPQQQLPDGFNPKHIRDNYLDYDRYVSLTKEWFQAEKAGLDHMAAHPTSTRRQHSDHLVIPESQRVPSARGLIFDVDAQGKLALTNFHAPIRSGLNLTMIGLLAKLSSPPPAPHIAPVLQPGHYCDLEMCSDILLGSRLKAVVHTHSLFNPHSLSLADNLAAIESQALDKESKGIATLNDHVSSDPCRYVACGTTERKDQPHNPRVTDNHSDPMYPFNDADGEVVKSLNQANRDSADPPDPKERKPSVPRIASDIMVLRHLGDRTKEAVHLVKLDMAYFFDQLALAPQERWKNHRFLRNLFR
jgi:hypothetical protein